MDASADGDSFATEVLAELTTEEPGTSTGLAALTQSERDVFELAAAGAGNEEIAGPLEIAPRTVGIHLRSILRKLDLESPASASSSSSAADAAPLACA